MQFRPSARGGNRQSTGSPGGGYPTSPGSLSPSSSAFGSPGFRSSRGEIASEQQEDGPGLYSIIHSSTAVSGSPIPGRSRIIANLKHGATVQVLELQEVSEPGRLRGRIEQPNGWISILNLEDGHRWAAPVNQGSTAGDANIARGDSKIARNRSQRQSEKRSGGTPQIGATNQSIRQNRVPEHSKVPKSVSSSTPGKPKPTLPVGERGKWFFDEKNGYSVALTTTNKVKPIEVNTKQEAIKMVKQAPNKFFGCQWIREGFEGKAHVFPRECEFFGKGFEAAHQPEAFGAMQAAYEMLPKDVRPDPDGYTDRSLCTFQGARYQGKSPGRSQGIADVPHLKLIGAIDPGDIRQGKVGDCWLLSAIAALAEFQGAVHKLFEKNQNMQRLPADEFNKYTVTLYDVRKWQPVDVVVDERLLCDEHGLLGCKPTTDGELWPCVLEKAFAAHCGGWDDIDGGVSTHAWRIMLGCKDVYTFQRDNGRWKCRGTYNPNDKRWEPLENSPHKGFRGLWPMQWPEVGGGGGFEQELGDNDFFERMCAWDDKNFIMCAGTCAGSDTEKTDGIVDGHAYTVVDCLDNAGGTEFDMIKVRNPWGAQEFECGDWVEGGKNWDRYKQVYEACGRPVKADDGIFWIEKKDFFAHFGSLYLCAKDMSDFIAHP